jgi:hypothetical protein
MARRQASYLRQENLGEVFPIGRKVMIDTQTIEEAMASLDQDQRLAEEIAAMAYTLTIQLALERLIPFEC